MTSALDPASGPRPIGTGPEGAELAARYIVEHAERRAGIRHRQGPWKPPLPCAADSPFVRLLSAERIHRLPRLAALALLAWADGHPVELLTTTPSARHVLSLQARGARCVSLLPDGAPTAPHADGFEFAVHDLCHLGKFIAPEHYAEQVGFFATVERAMSNDAWRAIEGKLDDRFRLDCEHVIADMNGSAVFLLSVFKMKLKMAARRRLASQSGAGAPSTGALSPAEYAAYRELLERTLDAFGFEGPLRAAAIETSARRDHPSAARLLSGHFREVGALSLRLVRQRIEGADQQLPLHQRKTLS